MAQPIQFDDVAFWIQTKCGFYCAPNCTWIKIEEIEDVLSEEAPLFNNNLDRNEVESKFFISTFITNVTV